MGLVIVSVANSRVANYANCVRFTILQGAAIFTVTGSLLAVAIPAFISNLSASKLSEPIDNLNRLVAHTIAYGNSHNGLESFPPSAPLTPGEVPRGVSTVDPHGTWDHLTWRALDFRVLGEHAFSYEFTSNADPVSGSMRFTATAHGDLDGDGNLSTFSVFGEKQRGGEARALPGIYIDKELE